MKITLRILIWTIPVAFLAVSAWQYYGLSGMLKIHHSFDGLSPLVNDPVPSARVSRRDGFPYIINDPVYIDVRMPRYFHSVTVQPVMENHDKLSVKFGAQLTGKEWNFDLRPFGSEPFTFDISTLALRAQKLRFIISAPELRGRSSGIVLKYIDITFEGTSLWHKIFSK